MAARAAPVGSGTRADLPIKNLQLTPATDGILELVREAVGELLDDREGLSPSVVGEEIELARSLPHLAQRFGVPLSVLRVPKRSR